MKQPTPLFLSYMDFPYAIEGGSTKKIFWVLNKLYMAKQEAILKHILSLLQVSYVLIVQPEDEKKGKGGGGEGEGDDDVYDFDGEPGTLAEFDPDAAEIKKPRPSQQVG